MSLSKPIPQTPVRILMAMLLGLWIHNVARPNAICLAADPVILTGHADPVYTVAFLPDGKRLVSGSFDRSIRLWDVPSQRTLRTMTGHTGLVLSVAVSKDGSKILSGSLDNQVRVWDVPVSTPLSHVQPHGGTLVSIAVARDGTQWISGGGDKALRIWNVADGQLIREVKDFPHAISKVSIQPDKQQFVAGDLTGVVRIVQGDGKTRATIGAHEGSVTSIAFSPGNNQSFFTTGVDGWIRRWTANAAPGKQFATTHEKPLTEMAVPSAGSLVATASHDETVRLWNRDNESLVRQLEGPTGVVRSLAWNSGSDKLATGGDDKTPRLFDANSGKLLKAFPEQAAGIVKLALHPNGQELAVADANGTLKIYKLDDAKELRASTPHTGKLTGLAYSSNQKQLVTCGEDKLVRVWNAADGTEVRKFEVFDAAKSLAVSHDGQLIVVAVGDQQLRLWNLADGMPMGIIPAGMTAVSKLEFSPDASRILAVCSDGMIRTWQRKPNSAEWQPCQSIPGGPAAHLANWVSGGQAVIHSGPDRSLQSQPILLEKSFSAENQPVHELACHPSAGQVLSAGDDGRVKLWDSSNGTVVREFLGCVGTVRAVAFSPNQQQVAAGGTDRALCVWNLNDGKLQWKINLPAEIVKVAFNASSKNVIVATSDHLIRSFDPTPLNPQPAAPPSQEPAQIVDGHTAGITSLGFLGTNEKLAISAASDGSVRTWSMAATGSVASLQGHASQVYAVAFSPTEKLAASASNDKTVKLWDLEKLQTVRTIAAQEGAIYAVTFTPDGKYFLTGGADKSVRLYQTDSVQEVRRYQGMTDGVYSVAISPKGDKLIAAGLDRKITLWDLDNPQPRKTFSAHRDDIYKVEFSAEGSRFLSVGYSGSLMLWNPQAENPVFSTKLPCVIYSAAFAADGNAIAVAGNDGKIHLVEVPPNAR